MQPYSDFDLDRATQDAWASFAERLAEVVASMDETGDLRIDALEGEPGAGFVTFQFVAPDDIRAEAASNADLDEDHVLDPGRLQVMEDAGWAPPSAEGSSRFTAVAEQEHTDTLATLAVVALRDVYGVPHPAFLAPDQLAEILTQRDQPALSEFDADDVVATMPSSQAHLEALVAAELEQLLGAPPLRDSDGDFALRVGSTMVFVRATPDAREAVVFSAVVHDVEGRSRAAELLNDLNAESRFVRFELVRDRVFVQMSVLAHPFVPAHLLQAVRAVSEVADGVDEELARKLHGRTTFGEG